VLTGLDSDHALGVRHLHRGIACVDDRHEFQDERPPDDVVVPDVEAGYLKRKHLLMLVVSYPADTSWLMCPIGVDNCLGMTLWNMSCTGIRSDRLRPISMKVFLMIGFNETKLWISVLATLCHPISNLTTNGKFLLDSSISGGLLARTICQRETTSSSFTARCTESS
jgi:hypothetical protein